MKNHIKLIKNISITIFILTIIIVNINIVQASVLQYMKDAGDAASYETGDSEKLDPTHLVGNIIKAFLSDRKSTRLNSSHTDISRMPSSA